MSRGMGSGKGMNIFWGYVVMNSGEAIVMRVPQSGFQMQSLGPQ